MMNVFVSNKLKVDDGVCAADCGAWIKDVHLKTKEELQKLITKIAPLDNYIVTDLEGPFNIDKNDDLIEFAGEVWEIGRLNKSKKVIEAVAREVEGCPWETHETLKKGHYNVKYDISSYKDFGMGILDDNYNVPEIVYSYIDFERLGKDVAGNDGWTIYEDLRIAIRRG